MVKAIKLKGKKGFVVVNKDGIRGGRVFETLIGANRYLNFFCFPKTIQPEYAILSTENYLELTQNMIKPFLITDIK